MAKKKKKKIEAFWRISLNIILWALLRMLTSLVIWNLNIMWVLPGNTTTSKP